MPKSRKRRKNPQPQTTKINLHPRAVDAIERQIERFRQKFGREPGPNDPIFFDPDADEPVPLSGEKIEAVALAAMKKAGTPPEYAYAYRRTGLLSLGGDMSLWPKDRREEWEAAVAEYRQMEEAAKQRKEL